MTLLLLLVPVLGVWTFWTAEENGWWMPETVTTYGPDIDFLFYLILWMVAVFFVLTEGLLVWFFFKYSKKDDSKGVFSHGNHKLELLWTVVPGILLLVIAFTQMETWAEIKYRGNLPKSEPIAHVWASQFDWRVQYPGADGEFGTWDDVESPHLFVVPSGEDVVFILHSRDVLHSFFVPEFRLKQDAVPGMAIPMWFNVNKALREEGLDPKDPDSEDKEAIRLYDLICAELCGWGHYKMAGRMEVRSREKFDEWMAEQQANVMSNDKEDQS
ncbi:MAG: cytochrome c oxidase subunit II [Planctomycetes bacterium]|nr:cytochrome c oxidase subunit II [Planctomycetota bacterium]